MFVPAIIDSLCRERLLSLLTIERRFSLQGRPLPDEKVSGAIRPRLSGYRFKIDVDILTTLRPER